MNEHQRKLEGVATEICKQVFIGIGFDVCDLKVAEKIALKELNHAFPEPKPAKSIKDIINKYSKEDWEMQFPTNDPTADEEWFQERYADLVNEVNYHTTQEREKVIEVLKLLLKECSWLHQNFDYSDHVSAERVEKVQAIGEHFLTELRGENETKKP